MYGGLIALLSPVSASGSGRDHQEEGSGGRQRGAGRHRGRPFAVNEDRVRALGITPRELEILEHIARGMSAREIAEALFVSENTVKTHSSRLFDKLGVNRRMKAVEAGRSLGLIP